MNNGSYTMGFSTRGLYLTQSLKLVELYIGLQNWDAVRKQALKENVLQSRTTRSAERSVGEILRRLKLLSREELTYLAGATNQEQGCLLWLAVCRRSKLIAEFAVEVLRERFLSLNTVLTYEDFDAFFYQKTTIHAELADIRTSIRKELRQVLFRMMREADLLTKENQIIEVHMSPGLFHLISQTDPRELEYFPMVSNPARRQSL